MAAKRVRISYSVELPEALERLTLRDLCRHTGVPPASIIDMVDFGVILPLEECPPHQWCFDMTALLRLRRAQRLRRDLNIEPSGLALALDLIEEVEELRVEVRRLQHRLQKTVGE